MLKKIQYSDAVFRRKKSLLSAVKKQTRKQMVAARLKNKTAPESACLKRVKGYTMQFDRVHQIDRPTCRSGSQRYLSFENAVVGRA